MTPSKRLGGFKVLKDVVRISLVSPEQMDHFPLKLCQVIAEAKINLPFITCVHNGDVWGINISVDVLENRRISSLIEDTFGKVLFHNTESTILSVFPHKSNPEVAGKLFEIFGLEGFEPEALANSPSAISIVLKKEILNRASSALFGPFSFGAYRTPADWKLAQKGKEQLYKEVVASYQEQRPKVYGLQYQEKQQFIHVKLSRRNLGDFGMALKECAALGLNLTFLATSPCREQGKENIFFCLPESKNHSYDEILNQTAPDAVLKGMTPGALFSMNGPHFGDRYGIVSELFDALVNSGIHILGLSCTIASIIGVVPSRQIDGAVQAIQGCFEVPTITKKGD